MEQNLNLYHIFYTVAKCRNISGAARQLFYQPAGHQQSDFPSGAESEHHSVSAFLQRGQTDGNRGNPFPAGGKRLRRHLPGGGTAPKGAGVGNGPSFHRRKLNFVQICTASLSQPFYQGKSAYPNLHFLPVHLSDHGGVGKRDGGYRAYRGE